MHPIPALGQEHRHILVILQALEKLCQNRLASGAMPARMVDPLLGFLRIYFEHNHLAKEESLLFPALVERGLLPEKSGPLAGLRAEHERARQLLMEMVETRGLLGREGWATAAFCDTGLKFVDLVRGHLPKEDQVIFPVAEQGLAPESQSQLAQAFAAHDQAILGDNLPVAFAAMVRDLQAKYLA